ncbi:low temperature requirement protein A [Actinomycetes bacterium KLBMP 9797]
MSPVTEGARVTPLELFFDLVFVFALTQVTAVMAGDTSPTWGGVLRGLLVLAVLWWCWCCFAWLGNSVRADEGFTRFALFGVMAVMFVVALTIPEAFDDLPGGLPAPLVFAACFLAVRLLHFAAYWEAATGNPALRRQLLTTCLVPLLAGATPLVIAAFVDNLALRAALWALALAADYSLVMLGGVAGWRIHSAAHWAERHGLIIIVALGESIVSIGVGVADEPISWPIIVASALGVTIAAALWWAYFDVSALLAEHALAKVDGSARAALGRDGYTYLHLPMVAGIILLSLGLKKVLEYVADTEHHTLSDPLHGVGLYALYGGVALYLLGHVAFTLRTVRAVSWLRLGAAVLVLVLIPVADRMPALAALALLAAVCAGSVAIESVRYAEHRREARAAHT